MDLLASLRMMGGLGVVLGLLAGALWIVRRFDLKLPGRIIGGPLRRIEVVERLPLDGRRSMALIRRDGREHLVLLAPEGPLLIETGIVRDDVDAAAEAARAEVHAQNIAQTHANAVAVRESFAQMVDQATTGIRNKVHTVREHVSSGRAGLTQVSAQDATNGGTAEEDSHHAGAPLAARP